MRSRFVPVAAAASALLLLAGCAGTNPLAGTAGSHGTAGFWAGLWHGLIAPVAFVISLFDHRFGIYEVHNSGALYDLGYVLGLGMGIGGSGRGSHRAARERR